jgi:cell shape-determining protein MreD
MKNIFFYFLLILSVPFNLANQTLFFRFNLIVPLLVLLVALKQVKKAYFLALVGGLIFDIFSLELMGFYTLLFLLMVITAQLFFKTKLIPYFWINLLLGVLVILFSYLVLVYAGQELLYLLQGLPLKPISLKVSLIRSTKIFLTSYFAFIILLLPAYFYLKLKRVELSS